MLVLPFLAILAAVGAFAIGSRIWQTKRPGWMVALFLMLFALAPARLAYSQIRVESSEWRQYEAIAAIIERVTPSNGLIYAGDETFYFLLHRVPPSGLENLHHHVHSPPPEVSTLRPASYFDELLVKGHFATIVMDKDDPKLEELHLTSLYSCQEIANGWCVMWNFKGRESD